MLLGEAIGLVIPALVVIEHQMIAFLDRTKTPYLNVSKVPADRLASLISPPIHTSRPRILICNIETLAREDIQAALLCVHLAYVALDEAQVGGGRREEGGERREEGGATSTWASWMDLAKLMEEW